MLLLIVKLKEWLKNVVKVKMKELNMNKKSHLFLNLGSFEAFEAWKLRFVSDLSDPSGNFPPRSADSSSAMARMW
jgi:hypothetical protein